MRVTVTCPRCGSVNMRLVKETRLVHCRDCTNYWSEEALLQYMRDKPGMNKSAPAFQGLRAREKVRSRTVVDR